MHYDFETCYDRSRDVSNKWNAMHGAIREAKPGVIPMSIPDMEFMMAPEIREGLKTAIDTMILGDNRPSPAYYEAVLSWQRRRHSYEAQADWLVPTAGILPAIFDLVRALVAPGDSVMILSPSCYPYAMAVKAAGGRVVESHLLRKGNSYVLDLDDLAEKAKESKLLLFSNPCNPSGKVWSLSELQELVSICAEHNVFIIDDESHQDLILPGFHHTALPTVSPEASRITAYCTSPAQGFNLTGFQLANIFIEDAAVREKLNVAKIRRHSLFQSPLSYEACRLAYTQGEPWLEALTQVIRSNAELVTRFLAWRMPEVRVFPLEGSYLLWADFRGLGLDHKELERLMEAADIYPDDGPMFGRDGRGFECFNIALPHAALDLALNRLADAWDQMAADRKANPPQHMDLVPGMDMPDFLYDTPEKIGLSFLAECRKKPTILLFHRYITCRICRTALSAITADYEKIQALGAQVKVVIQSTPESVHKILGDTNPYPVELICDPNRVLYNRFNAFPADSMFSLPGDEFLERSAMVFRMFNSRGTKAEGDRYQVPCWFIIGTDGKVHYSLYCDSLSQKPDAETMKKAILG